MAIQSQSWLLFNESNKNVINLIQSLLSIMKYFSEVIYFSKQSYKLLKTIEKQKNYATKSSNLSITENLKLVEIPAQTTNNVKTIAILF